MMQQQIILIRTLRRLSAVGLIIAGAAFASQAALAQDQNTQPAVYSVQGVIQRINADDKTVVVQHEEIPDYMPAMTMPFEVRDIDELAGLQPGDRITFKLNVTRKEGWIEQVEKIDSNSKEPVQRTERPMLRPVPDVEVLEEGDTLPDYQFTNELGRAVSLQDFRGSALGITFIYTRCPYPTFCPQMSRMFAEAQQQLKTRESVPDNWRLLSITIDPDYDTPQTLKDYARDYDYDPDRWSFLRASLYDVDALTQQFNMATAWSPEDQTLTHQLRTAVIEPDGRIRKILKYNQWTVEQFVDEIIGAARNKDQPQETQETGASG